MACSARRPRRELLGVAPRTIEPEEDKAAMPDEPCVLPCPRCGAGMIIIEAFSRCRVSILDHSRKTVLSELPGQPATELTKALKMESVRVLLRTLRTFPLMTSLASKGQLSLHRGYFDIATGTLSALNQTTDKFVRMAVPPDGQATGHTESV